MLFGRKPEKKERATNPAWLKWMVAAFIGYAIFVNYSERKERVNTGSRQASELENAGQSVYEKADTQTFTLPNNVQVTGELKGQGQTAYCGMIAIANITPVLAKKEGDTITKKVIVGADNEDVPWAAALQGMKEGGVRKISLSETIDTKLQKTSSYKIELKDVLPDENDKEMIAYQALERTIGRGVTARCGLEADFAVILRDQYGKVAYDSTAGQNHLTTIIGENSYFYGLEKGLLGMKPTGIRTLIIPPSYIVLGDKVPEDMRNAIVPGTLLIAEITLVKLRNPKLNAKPIELLPAKKENEDSID